MQKPRVVIVGGGFAGMMCAKALKNTPAEIVLIDRRNFHLFQPLLYQVATGGLSPANIAAPLRCIFRRQSNVQVILGTVAGFDRESNSVEMGDGTNCKFDFLVVATGATHHYFGNDSQWEPIATGLKTIEDATKIRRKILLAFEKAERCADPQTVSRLLTFVVVGGGPTGVEMAGSIAELAKQTMRRDFRAIDPTKARVILVENSQHVLERYHQSLSLRAAKDLESLGIEVLNETRLTEVHHNHVVVTRHGEPTVIETENVVWAAGVKASPLAQKLAETYSLSSNIVGGGRITVTPHCSLEGFPNIFALGDMANFTGVDNKPLPGVAPVAVQQGEYVGKRIHGMIMGTSDDKSFRYWDKGNMATIGRSRAIVESGKWRMTGKLAWLAWLFVHILYLAKFENRVLVLFQWFWNYITRNRTARLITGEDDVIRG